MRIVNSGFDSKSLLSMTENMQAMFNEVGVTIYQSKPKLIKNYVRVSALLSFFFFCLFAFGVYSISRLAT